MTWNLRLVDMKDPEYPDEKYYEIREVFYDTLGKPIGHGSATIGGDSTDEIRTYLEWALESLNKPILKFGE